MKILVLLLASFSLLTVTACENFEQRPIPKGVKVGKPYVIKGKRYYPRYDEDYDRVGTASWYGPNFHGKLTANGETYDQNAYTAAHPTLPMPSIVRVTNLDNGRTVIARINDRGPFAENRIIDLSKRSAQAIGMSGLAKVRVTFLPVETRAFSDSVKQGAPLDMVELNLHGLRRVPAQVKGVVPRINPAAPSAPTPSIQTQELQAPVAPRQPTITTAWASDNITLPEPPKPVAAKPAPRVEKFVMPKAKPLPPEPQEAAPVQFSHEKAVAPKKAVSSSPGKGILITAGSFGSQDNANKLGKRLGSIGDTHVDTVTFSGKTWWRVRVGPFSSSNNAQSALAKIKASGVPDAHISKTR